MTRIHNNHKPTCCGECTFFKHEDIDGYGYCDIVGREKRCSDVCYFTNYAIGAKEAAKILHYHQKWRRGGNSEMPAPWIIGAAIDVAIHELRENSKNINNYHTAN